MGKWGTKRVLEYGRLAMGFAMGKGVLNGPLRGVQHGAEVFDEALQHGAEVRVLPLQRACEKSSAFLDQY